MSEKGDWSKSCNIGVFLCRACFRLQRAKIVASFIEIMPEEEKSPRPKLIVPGAEKTKKKASAVVTSETESLKPRVLLPESGDVGKSQSVVAPKSDEKSVSRAAVSKVKVSALTPKVEAKGNTGPKVLVKSASIPRQDESGGAAEKVALGIEALEGEEQPVDVGPAPEGDGIDDIVGSVGLSEEVIAELDEVAEREERARIAEQERVRAIEEANRKAEEERRAWEEAQRSREAEEAARQKNEQVPYGYAIAGQPGYAQQGYPSAPPGYGYPQPHQGMSRPPQGVADESAQRRPAMEVKAPSGIPGWALYVVGFLSGALVLLILFMATPMGEGLISKSLVRDGWKPPVKRVQSSGVQPSASRERTPFLSTPNRVD